MIHTKNKRIKVLVHTITLFIVLFIGPAISFGQPGGKAFQFLEITNSARVAALGGDAVAINDEDPDLAYYNPSLLNRDMHHHLALNYVNYFAGTNFGYASAAAKLGQKGTIAGGIHYLYYGTFQGADENGLLSGKFHAADYSVNVMYSHPLDSLITFGFTVKTIYSDYEMYNSTALAFDAGVSYYNPDTRFTAGLVLRNMGFQVDAYYPNGGHEPLPFSIALGISKRLEYAPLTFFIMANHLEKWDLTYKTEADKKDNTALDTGESSSKSNIDLFVDKFMRHIIIGTAFNLGNNLVLRAGYNYRRRKEMKIDTKPGMVGFSWGIGLMISKFQISYGRATYHLAGGTNQFSFSMNLDEFSKKF
jgi:hypothetical protein